MDAVPVHVGVSLALTDSEAEAVLVVDFEEAGVKDALKLSEEERLNEGEADEDAEGEVDPLADGERVGEALAVAVWESVCVLEAEREGVGELDQLDDLATEDEALTVPALVLVCVHVRLELALADAEHVREGDEVGDADDELVPTLLLEGEELLESVEEAESEREIALLAEKEREGEALVVPEIEAVCEFVALTLAVLVDVAVVATERDKVALPVRVSEPETDRDALGVVLSDKDREGLGDSENDSENETDGERDKVVEAEIVAAADALVVVEPLEESEGVACSELLAVADAEPVSEGDKVGLVLVLGVTVLVAVKDHEAEWVGDVLKLSENEGLVVGADVELVDTEGE